MAHLTALVGRRSAPALVLIGALWLLCGADPPGVAPADVALPAPTSSALSANAAAVRTVQLAWDKQPTNFASADELVKRIGRGPASAAVLPMRVKRFAWQDGKFYERSVLLSSIPNEPIGGKTRPIETEACFDGRLHYAGTPREEGVKAPEPVLTVNSRTVWAKRLEDRPVIYSEYWEQAGYDFERTAATVDLPPRSLILHRITSGRGCWRFAMNRSTAFPVCRSPSRGIRDRRATSSTRHSGMHCGRRRKSIVPESGSGSRQTPISWRCRELKRGYRDNR